jgi:hypothetical protein
MKALHRRLEALEGAGSGELHPALRRWLGMPLTEDEQREADAYEPPAVIDTSGWSTEVKEWLGVN